jgi:hypothetical protein
MSQRNKGNLPILGRPSGITEGHVLTHSIAVLMAKLIEDTNGDRQPLEQSMAVILADPELAGGVILALVNLIDQYATASGTNPKGMMQLCDFLISVNERHANARG